MEIVLELISLARSLETRKSIVFLHTSKAPSEMEIKKYLNYYQYIKHLEIILKIYMQYLCTKNDKMLPREIRGKQNKYKNCVRRLKNLLHLR